MITLSKALAENRLEEFIQQQESAGVNPVVEKDFQQLTEKLIKSEQSEDQTSRSVSRDGSTGKQTR